VVGKLKIGINIRVNLGLNGKMCLWVMIFLEMQCTKECAEIQPGIENIDQDMCIFGGQMDGIPNGMKDMLGLAIGLIGIDVIKYKKQKWN